MSYLRKAVDTQKSILINTLIKHGVFDAKDTTIHNKTISELVTEYESFKQANGKKSI